MTDIYDAIRGSSEDPARPEGMHPEGQADGRYPVAFEESVPAGLLVLSRFFAAIAKRDVEALAATLHFPFATIEGTEPEVVESKEQLLTSPPKSLNLSGSGSRHIQPGSYDILDRIELHIFNSLSAGCSMTYNRYSANGNLAQRCDGIYTITNNDGKWAIELMSTMFTPAAAIHVTYEDTIQNALRRGHDWMLGYTLRSQDLLNSTRQYGKSAGVGTNNPRANAGNARKGDPMAGFRIKGVKSRLRVSEVTPESVAGSDNNFVEFAGWAGGGVGDWEYTINHPDARILHATVDKAHTMGGYIRYTGDSRPTSETRGLGILTYRNGRWGSSGGAGQMMYHDLTNSLPTK